VGLLKLEITESSVIEEAVVKSLCSIREMGVHLSVDDFGTGYSSLDYLRRLPVDIVKLDRSFVCEVEKNSDDAALVTAIIVMAHSLRMKVVAEGVETFEQLRFLQAAKCDLLQGYLFQRPVEQRGFLKLLDNGEEWVSAGSIKVSYRSKSLNH
jgi:EAL domain-containing protein (putative c-di-GMP-specific phosphodiesterase class I)